MVLCPGYRIRKWLLQPVEKRERWWKGAVAVVIFEVWVLIFSFAPDPLTIKMLLISLTIVLPPPCSCPVRYFPIPHMFCVTYPLYISQISWSHIGTNLYIFESERDWIIASALLDSILLFSFSSGSLAF